MSSLAAAVRAHRSDVLPAARRRLELLQETQMVQDRWTIGRRLHAGFGALLLLTVLAGGVAIWGSSRIKADVETVTQRSADLQQALTIQTALFKIEGGEKSILWAGLDNDRRLYDASKSDVSNQYEL